jgi:hypothetical protein
MDGSWLHLTDFEPASKCGCILLMCRCKKGRFVVGGRSLGIFAVTLSLHSLPPPLPEFGGFGWSESLHSCRLFYLMSVTMVCLWAATVAFFTPCPSIVIE